MIRAPLAHLYFEQIHPFWDGNGRVGRAIEAPLLQTAGYRYAPFALARHYLANIDSYFTPFNTCRKAADKKQAAPNQPFIEFHLEGMRQTINDLHDRINRIVAMLLYESNIRRALDEKRINARQYTIVSQLLDKGHPLPLEEVRSPLVCKPLPQAQAQPQDAPTGSAPTAGNGTGLPRHRQPALAWLRETQ